MKFRFQEIFIALMENYNPKNIPFVRIVCDLWMKTKVSLGFPMTVHWIESEKNGTEKNLFF